jgi:hypothetical protein
MNTLWLLVAEVYAGSTIGAADVNGQIRRALSRDALVFLEQRALNAVGWRYDIGCIPFRDQMLARPPAKLTQEEIYQLESELLEQIGFALPARAF